MGHHLCGLADELAGRSDRQGACFWSLGLALMMIFFMPLAGNGLFALSLGLPATVAALVLHLVYGAVLSVVYAKFAHA
jgi:hypothetical protein